MLSQVLGWAAFAAAAFMTGQAVLCWRSVRRSQVILICVSAACGVLVSLLGGVH